MSKTMYVAKYSYGSYEDERTVNVFVSEDRNKVENWAMKFNSLLTKLSDFYNKRLSGFPRKGKFWNHPEYQVVLKRVSRLYEISDAETEEIEYRSGGPDLKKLEKAVDKLLAEFTKESSQEWLDEKRK